MCKVCGGHATFVGSCSNEVPLLTLETFRCCDCGLVFIATSLNGDQLATAYRELDEESYYREVEPTTRCKFATALSDLAPLLRKDSRIIDLGTGDGAFPLYLKNHGYEFVSAHEIPGSNLSHLNQAGIVSYQDIDYQSLPRNHFDVVTLLDVAEHVLDPRFLFNTCAEILKPGGFVYVHTPMVTPLDRLMHIFQKVPGMDKVGSAWQRGRTSIYHLQNYTPVAMKFLLEHAGFSGISIHCQNELSWPVRRYVEVYACKRLGLGAWTASALTFFARPVIGTNLLNPNKGIVIGRLPGTEH